MDYKGGQAMYGTGMGGYLDRQRNEELSREIGTLRLEARLRSSRQHRTTSEVPDTRSASLRSLRSGDSKVNA